MKQQNPGKKHFNRLMKNYRAYWITSTNEVLVNISKGVYNNLGKAQYESHYPTELGLSYGIQKGLIEIKPDSNGRYDIFPTSEGLALFIEESKRHCAFTGRKV